MAQGVFKTKASKTSKPLPSKNGVTKKGARTIAPKKVSLLKQQKMTKKFSAGLNAKTEKMLGEKVGHLELLGVGKKKPKGEKGQKKEG